MNIEESLELTELLKNCRAVSGRNLSDSVIKMYVTELEKYDFHKIESSIKVFFNRGKFPSIHEIETKMGVSEIEIDPLEKARLLTQSVIGAIGRFGWCNEKEAQKYFGEDWPIIVGFQSWHMLCSMTNDDLPIFSAQFRSYVEVRHKVRHNDSIDTLSLGEGKNITVKSIVDEQIKRLTASVDLNNS